jgi:predicted secreted Zn-dependent protease
MAPDIYNGWQIFERFVKEHEDGHAEITRQLTRALQNALASLATRSTCDALRADMRILFQKNELELEQRQKAYDDQEAGRQVPGSVFN